MQRFITTLALTVSLALLTPSLADAKRGQKARNTAAEQKYVASCVHERTGPVGGIEPADAVKLCKGIVKANKRILRAAERAAKAIEACEQAVVDACVDAAQPGDDVNTVTSCEDDALRATMAFDVCGGAAP